MKLTAWDRFLSWFAPSWGLERARARAALDLTVRHYEAAQPGRRTSGWNRNRGDANATTYAATSELRLHARDLIRNVGWARRGQKIVANNAVGWGIVPKAIASTPAASAKAQALWKAWADSTDCDTDGTRTFAGIQQQVMKAVFSDGEVLIRRRPRLMKDGLAIPLQLQILEADHLDTSQDGYTGLAGGPVVQGVEFDMIGRRAAYYVFREHPGSSRVVGQTSVRIPASEIAHVYMPDRPAQVRGVSWLAAAIVDLKDLDELDDAELLKQKIAACFAAFVTDDGSGTNVGTPSDTDDQIETLEPGMIHQLTPGKTVTFGNPPTAVDGGLAIRKLRKIAASIGITYEDMTGDYSQVNFSSARMGRIAHIAHLQDWQWNMIVPMLCQRVWRWAMEQAQIAGLVSEIPGSDWTVPPLPMIEPDKEGLAYSRLVRNGAMTWSAMIREQGGDPEAHWIEYAADMAKLDELGIQLDSDVRAVSQAGLTQARAGVASQAAPPAQVAGDPSSAGRDASDDVEIEIDPAEFDE